MEGSHVAALPAAGSLVPFILLLGLIALGPLWFAGWWGRHYPKVALGLGALVAGYYWIALHNPHALLHTALEYVSFISLIGSLYVVSGGILLRVKGESTPLVNTVFLGVGALIANLVGTTGASMLLIRPWLRMNRYRVTMHHVVFFIFLVSNVGGLLTPIGDPPLYLGYLIGVPFWWVAQQLWAVWLVAVGSLLVIFYVLDRRNYQRAPQVVRDELAEPPDQWQCRGAVNFLWLAVILGAVFVTHPPFVREALMLGAAAGSYFTTPRPIHEANHFNWHPVQEVAILFVGIFATMIPALELLQAHARSLGTPTPALFYWASGSLSGVLDNAPTYLCFLQASFGALVDADALAQLQQLVATSGAQAGQVAHQITGPHAEEIRRAWTALQAQHPGAIVPGNLKVEQLQLAYMLGNATTARLVAAISAGAVFFGAMTYIGNGPNFMVKSIADQSGVHTPSFLGYVTRFSLPCLLPVLAVVWWVFFR